jgi:hypothetical protein
MTGRLDETDAQKFRRSPEYRYTTRSIIDEIADCEHCSERVRKRLGYAAVVRPARAQPMNLSKLFEFCGRVEGYVSIDDLAPALDDLVYPVAGRERELCGTDRVLAKRVLDAIEKGDPVVLQSKIALPQADEYRRKVADTLAIELMRTERFEAFRRDFGQVAYERATGLY